MSAFISYTSFDGTVTAVIPVIASFDSKGHISPLYVRLGRSSYRISDYFVNSRYSGITEFRCKVRDGDTEKPLQLTYYSAENMWTVPRADIGPEEVSEA